MVGPRTTANYHPISSVETPESPPKTKLLWGPLLDEITRVIGFDPEQFDVQETVEIMSNEEFSNQILEAAKEIEQGKTRTHREIFGHDI